jgi:glycosyltransferase involved in cell wall biosynthesis
VVSDFMKDPAFLASRDRAPISVVIPCYRCQIDITRSLDSVLNQTLQPAEILLIDDASGDGTLEVLRQFEKLHAPRLRVIALEQNGGPGLARNAGWDASTQPWLAFLDADDVWHPRKLEIQWAWLLDHPDVVLCGHGSRLADWGLNHPIGNISKATRLTKFKMLVSCRLPTRSVMLRSDLPYRFKGRAVAEDYLLWLQIIAENTLAFRMEVCLAYSLRPDFSPGGYSGQLWTHEKRELAALRALRAERNLTWFVFVVSSGWSLLKFLRRLWIMRRAR